MALISALLAAGFAAGFPIGRSQGFLTGSEWSLVQANILAREAGLFMPVNFKDGQFTIMLKQPNYLYRSSWQLADKQEDELVDMNRGERTLNEHIQLTRNTSLQR